jgi:hypothetical protein
MNPATTGNNLVMRAADALKAVLREISSVKLTELRCEPLGHSRVSGILARIDIFGRSHTLACEVEAQGNPQQLMTTLHNLHESRTHRDAESTLVIIAPYLSPEAQAVCKESQAGFLDLEGNARIAVDEIFISKRTMLPRMQRLDAADSVIVHAGKTRSPAPMVYIASDIPVYSVPVRKDAPAGTAVA